MSELDVQKWVSVGNSHIPTRYESRPYNECPNCGEFEYRGNAIEMGGGYNSLWEALTFWKHERKPVKYLVYNTCETCKYEAELGIVEELSTTSMYIREDRKD